MRISAEIQARLAATDAHVVRGRGAAGDALRRTILAGSRVAVINPGSHAKRFMYERAKALGVELVLVGRPDSWARSLVDDGVAVRYIDVEWPGDPDEAADLGLSALNDESGLLDGVVTFWEDAVPTVARVAETLGLPGSPPAAADTARSKERTLEASRRAGLPTPDYMHLRGARSLPAAAERIGFPAVIKPIFGAEAMGVVRADDLQALEAAYARDRALIGPDFDPIFEQGSGLILEEYLDGTEFDVDIVLSNGACVFAATSENWPTNEPYFVETGLHTPSWHPPDRLAAVTDLCIRTALALGFTDAVLHVEAKDTSRGPRLLEVNARLGGGRTADDHLLVTGVDLVEQVLLTSVGIPVAPSGNREPACGIALFVVEAPRSGILRHARFLDHLAGDSSVYQADVKVPAGSQVTARADGFPTSVAEVSVRAADAMTARTHVRELVDALEIPID